MSTLIQRPSVLGTGSVHCGPLWNLPKPRKATGEPAGSREAQFWPQHWFHSCCLPTFLKKNWAVLNPNSKSNYCQPPAHAKKRGTKLVGYTASGKNLSGKGELWSSVRKCGKGVRNTAEARPSQDWAAEGSKWVRPKPPRGHAYQITRLREQSHKKKTQDVHLGEFRRCQGRRNGILGAEGWRVASSHTLWSDSDLESVTGPTGIRGPGRGNLSGLCFFQKDRHRRETCGEILIIQIFENHLPNSKETVIFQYSPYY